MAEFQTNLEYELESELKNRGAEIVFFTDISHLPHAQTRGYPNAILLLVTLSPGFIQILSRLEDEFSAKENKMDELADQLADVLSHKGYRAYSQSENNLVVSGAYKDETKESPLPHKTIASLAGVGWIGKHNLMASHEFGSAFSMCSVLTDAPLKTVLHAPAASECGDCTICVNNCPENALTGKSWSPESFRAELIDVYRCTACLKCLALCPWTQKYAGSTLSNTSL